MTTDLSTTSRLASDKTDATPNSVTKTALVFGGSGYIGREVCAQFIETGYDVLFTYYQGKENADQLCREHKNCAGYQLDLTDPVAIRAFFDALQRDNITPNQVVFCAAIAQQKDFLDISVDDWGHMLRLNCQSIFNTCQSLYHIAKQQPKALRNIVLMSAVNHGQGFELPLHFAASQGAINQFVASAAILFGREGTCINVVVPGILEHGLADQIADQLKNEFIQFSALGRLGTAREVARFIRWLATQNTYINGQCLPVNGGI